MKLPSLAGLLCLTASLGVHAAPTGISDAAYQTERADISATHQKTMEYCAFLSGNTREVCIAEADGKQGVARAELEATYRPSAKRTYSASLAAVEADFSVNMKRCADKEVAERAACLEVVRAARRTAQADADMALENSRSTPAEAKRAARIRGTQAANPR